MNKEDYEKALSLQEKINDTTSFIKELEDIREKEINYIGFKFKDTNSSIMLYPSLDVQIYIEDYRLKDLDILNSLNIFLNLLKEKSEKELEVLEEEFNKL